jgi:addiction module HigA family antidote
MSKTSLVSPGIVLKENFMKPFQLKPAQLAKGLGINPAVVSNVLNSKQRITLPIALRLAKFFKTEEKYWIDLQFQYDYAKVSNDPELKTALKNIIPVSKPKEQAAAAPAKKPKKTVAPGQPPKKSGTNAPAKRGQKVKAD